MLKIHSFFQHLARYLIRWRARGAEEQTELRREEKKAGSFPMAPIPKIIWTLWLQGWDQAPEIVQACLATWRKHNADWTIHALTASDLNTFLEEEAFSALQGKTLEPEALSDVIRLALLQRYGGVWVDGTVYCLRPLAQWLFEAIDPSGFFAFAQPAGDRRMLSSWFLAASKGNYLVQQWHDQTQKYWLDRTQRDEYFWVHGLFEKCCQADEQFRTLWEAAPKMSAKEPHYYKPYQEQLYRAVSSEDQRIVETAPFPVLKLTHKLKQDRYPGDSVLRALCDSAHDRPAQVTRWRARRTAAIRAPMPHFNPRKVLVTWYGSFEGHGTIGDLLAMYSATSHLVGKGHQVYHASAADFPVPGAQRVDWTAVSPKQFNVMLFVCGPILKGHAHTPALFERFKTCRTLGVGVSLFPDGHRHFTNPFDHVLAREGRPERFEDIAIIAPRPATSRPVTSPEGKTSIGVVLRGRQPEYGAEACLWEQTEDLVRQLTDSLIAGRGGEVIQIENHLRRSRLMPHEIEEQYRRCHLIISSRFHGAILAARHGVPFIALDQIAGGAKVSALLGASGWPHVFQTAQTNVSQLRQSARQLLAGDFQKELLERRNAAIRQANVTLAHLDQLIEQSD